MLIGEILDFAFQTQPSGFSKMYHCTFYNNTAALGGGAVGTSNYIANQPTPSLHNCIAWNNSSLLPKW